MNQSKVGHVEAVNTVLPLHQRLERLFNAISYLEDSIGVLHERLNPYMRPEPSITEGKPQNEKEASSPFVGAVDDMIERIGKCGGRVTEFIERLEI